MTPEQREELKTAAQRAEPSGCHIYTNPRDSNGWEENSKFQELASPAAILSLIAQVEAQATEREKLLNIIASAYQIAGKHDAPALVLDVLADPLAATEEQVEAMLPYQASDNESLREEIMALSHEISCLRMERRAMAMVST